MKLSRLVKAQKHWRNGTEKNTVVINRLGSSCPIEVQKFDIKL